MPIRVEENGVKRMVIDNDPLGQKAVLNDRFGHDTMKLWIHTQPAKSTIRLFPIQRIFLDKLMWI